MPWDLSHRHASACHPGTAGQGAPFKPTPGLKMLIKLVSRLPGGALRGWDVEQRNFVGRAKSQESSKRPLRGAGPSETAAGRRRAEQGAWRSRGRRSGSRVKAGGAETSPVGGSITLLTDLPCVEASPSISIIKPRALGPSPPSTGGARPCWRPPGRARGGLHISCPPAPPPPMLHTCRPCYPGRESSSRTPRIPPSVRRVRACASRRSRLLPNLPVLAARFTVVTSLNDASVNET